jgi:hypothetical protein
MPELGSYGSVRGARGNSRPYREQAQMSDQIISVANDPFRKRTVHRNNPSSSTRWWSSELRGT